MADTPFSPKSFLLGFTAFASKAFSDTESAMSPTSILDAKPFSALKYPFLSEPTPPKFIGEGEVGLQIVENGSTKKGGKNKFALLKIQIPNPAMEFGIKTRNSQPGLVNSPKFSSGSLNLGAAVISSAEIELSEDYTCVTSRGGHVTKMTRIFDDCVLDSCYGDPPMSSSSSSVRKESFLSFCHTCRKSLGEGKDIYMYRGEKAFCSVECRDEEMVMEEELEKHGGVIEDDEFGSW